MATFNDLKKEIEKSKETQENIPEIVREIYFRMSKKSILFCNFQFSDPEKEQ